MSKVSHENDYEEQVIDPIEPANTIKAIHTALRTSSHQTGVSFDYMLALAKHESSLQPSAQAKTSSASGLFQFIERTWMSLIQDFGEKYGLINNGKDSKLDIADEKQRQQILELRNQPKAAALMAGELTKQSENALVKILDRKVEPAELYLSHFLGAAKAGRFIIELENNPHQIGVDKFSSAASANQNVFYDNKNQPRNLQQIYNFLGKKFENIKSENIVTQQHNQIEQIKPYQNFYATQSRQSRFDNQKNTYQQRPTHQNLIPYENYKIELPLSLDKAYLWQKLLDNMLAQKQQDSDEKRQNHRLYA